MQIWTKRAYDKPGSQDGTRVLVDRIWPRGVSRDEAQIDYWLKEIAPSDDLRKWYGHDTGRWSEFKRSYIDELISRQNAVKQLCELAREGRVTLVFGARDTRHNNATVLKEFLNNGAC